MFRLTFFQTLALQAYWYLKMLSTYFQISSTKNYNPLQYWVMIYQALLPSIRMDNH